MNQLGAAQVGEAILAGGATLLLGMDAAFQVFDDEDKRLGSNLGLICLVSVLCMNCYYLQTCDDDDDSITAVLCVEPDGVVAIATGYMVLWVTTLVFIILYICTCCTCNCKDKCLVRVLLAIALVVGAVITAIGYYVYAGNYDSDANLSPDSDNYTGKVVAYYIGYSILVGGLPITWALDIALDDVKNSQNYKK